MLIKLLDINHFARTLKPVTSTSIQVGRTDKFHEEGLFSEIIFGKEKSSSRKSIFSYIELGAIILHPTVYNILNILDRKIPLYISTEKSFSVNEVGALVEDQNGETGLSSFIKQFPNIKFKGGSSTRDGFIDVLQKSYKDKTIFIDKIPVIPPDLRPVSKDEETGELTLDPLNDFYLTVLRRSMSMRTVGKSGPIFDIMNYWLQISVNNCDDFIRSKIARKAGLIRSQILGKRIEFSARAVIVNGPNLKPNEIGIPFRIAINLFQPFIIHNLLYIDKEIKSDLEQEIKDYNKMDLSIDSIKKIMISIQNNDKIPERLFDIFYKATEEAMRGRYVLAKRDPVLHPESVRAFTPILTNQNAISLCN